MKKKSFNTSIFLSLLLASSVLFSVPAFATHSETGSGEIHGIKWNDLNNDSIFDDGIEPKLSNVIINMTSSDNTISHEIITDINGEYWFTGLESGSYIVYEDAPDFTLQTFPANFESHLVTITSGEIVNNKNFGNFLVGPSEIHGTIFQDITNVGTFDVGDTGLSGVSVIAEIYDSTNTFPHFSAIVQTNPTGDYAFLNMNPGIYQIRAFVPFSPSVQTVPINNQPAIVTLTGQVESNVNVGYHADFGTVTGTTFIDFSENGIHNAGEPTAAFNQICVSPGNTCTFSNGAGFYTLNLPPGTYDVFAGSWTNTGSSTFTTITVPSLVNGQTIPDIDIPYRDLIPLPGDMAIPNSNGETDGVPTLIRSQSLTIVKNISVCVPVEPPLTTLTLSDGTMLTQTMQNIPATTLWTNDFGSVGSGQSSANIRVDIDCPPDTVGYPDNVGAIGPEDVIQIGDLIFYDPSGQVINQCTNEPITGAITTLSVAAPQGTTNFVFPDASSHLPSTNPQITDSDGNYGWVTIPGDYTVTAAKSGFTPNTSPIVTIPPPVTGLDIYLTPVNGCIPIPPCGPNNPNLFVSTENRVPANDFGGPMVTEVIICDADIVETTEGKGDPDVTVNGKDLRMAQDVDGLWHGYFADATQAQLADQGAIGEGFGNGLDFGYFCSNESIIPISSTAFLDTVAIALPVVTDGVTGSQGTAPLPLCSGSAILPNHNNVVHNFTPLNPGISPFFGIGQLDITSEQMWPFVQLYNLDQHAGSVYVQYNKGGGAQSSVSTFDSLSPTVDSDGDGIANIIDSNPTNISSTFSDVPLVGTTSGTITSIGDQILTITESINPAGVLVSASPNGGVTSATIVDCDSANYTITPGDAIVITCGSSIAQVIQGPIEIEYFVNGVNFATMTLQTGDDIIFDQDELTFTNNGSVPVVLLVNGEPITVDAGETVMLSGDVILCHKDKKTLTLPSEAVDAHLAHGDELSACDDD